MIGKFKTKFGRMITVQLKFFFFFFYQQKKCKENIENSLQIQETLKKLFYKELAPKSSIKILEISSDSIAKNRKLAYLLPSWTDTEFPLNLDIKMRWLTYYMFPFSILISKNFKSRLPIDNAKAEQNVSWEYCNPGSSSAL